MSDFRNFAFAVAFGYTVLAAVNVVLIFAAFRMLRQLAAIRAHLGVIQRNQTATTKAGEASALLAAIRGSHRSHTHAIDGLIRLMSATFKVRKSVRRAFREREA